MSVAVKIYDKNLDIVADLQNAFDVQYTKRINEVWTGSFTLPADDDKNDLFSLLYFAELYDGGKKVGLFRIDEKYPERTNDHATIRYECSHVLDTLNDDYIGVTSKVTKTGTNTAISYILDQQDTTNWQLGTLDFSKGFEHEFNRQTLLRALLDVPQPWWEDYQLTFDTSSYPWTLNLIQPDTTPKGTLRYSKNMIQIEKEENAKDLITKLYAFGEGSGDDQVTAGPYTSNTGTYGTIVGIWEEQYFDNSSDLGTAAQKYLSKTDTPKTIYRGDAADIYQLIGANRMELGEYITIYDEELGLDNNVRIVQKQKTDVGGDPGTLRLELSNKSRRFPDYGALAFRDEATEDNLATGSVSGGSGGALASGGVGPDEIDNITMDHIESGDTYDKVLKTDISAGHILLSETQGDFGDIDGDLDQIPDGATYNKVKETDISAGHVVLSETYYPDGTTKADLDALPDGSSYGRVNKTDIDSGSIVLQKTKGDIDDVPDGTNYRRAPDGWFYSTTTIDGGKIETDTITVDQILVNSDINMSESGVNSITGAEHVGGDSRWTFFGSSIQPDADLTMGGYDIENVGNIDGFTANGNISMGYNDINNVGTVDGKDIGAWTEDTTDTLLRNPSSDYVEIQLADGSTMWGSILTGYGTDTYYYVSY